MAQRNSDCRTQPRSRRTLDKPCGGLSAEGGHGLSGLGNEGVARSARQNCACRAEEDCREDPRSPRRGFQHWAGETCRRLMGAKSRRPTPLQRSTPSARQQKERRWRILSCNCLYPRLVRYYPGSCSNGEDQRQQRPSVLDTLLRLQPSLAQEKQSSQRDVDAPFQTCPGARMGPHFYLKPCSGPEGQEEFW